RAPGFRRPSTAGCRGRGEALRRSAQPPLRPLSVARIDNNRPPRYSALGVLNSDNKAVIMRVLVLGVVTALLLVPSASAWTWPADGPVLRGFSFSASNPYAAGQHRGIDVAGDSGASVPAPAGGTISFAGAVPSGGETVTIETQDGYSVTLLHLGSIAVKRNAAVSEGD